MSGQESNKRPGEPHEGPSSKRSMRSSGPAAGKKVKNLEPLNPYEIPDPVDAILPSEILSLPGFSKEIYAQDMFAIFSATTASNPELAEMHKAWFDSRKPSLEELWKSRHPENGGYRITVPKEILRKICTLEKLLQMATEEALVTRLQTLLMDHLMLMGVSYTSWELPLHYFPDFREQFRSLVDTLSLAQPSLSSAGKFNASSETRAKIESFLVDPSTVTPLDSISGNIQGKKVIHQAIFISTELPHLAAEGIASQGILLHGPPGTGKTLLAMASAAQSKNYKVFSVLSSDLIDKWQGSSEQNVAALFAIAEENAPAIIVIDEVEGLCRSRQSTSTTDGSMHRIANTFLACMTRSNWVTVIGTTNLPWCLDQAFGHRFPIKIHVTLPSEKELAAIVQSRLTRLHHGLSQADISKLARHCEHFTGDVINQIVNVTLRELAGEIQSATHFRSVEIGGRIMLCPCEPGDFDSMKRTFQDIKNAGSAGQVTTRALTFEMLRDHAETFKAEVSASQAADLKHKRWASQNFYD